MTRGRVVSVHRALAALGLAVLAAGCAGGRGEADRPFRVLVFSKTNGYRHASIPDGVAALREVGAAGGFTVDATEDSLRFRPDVLARYRVVVFLSTSGDVLGTEGEAAFQAFVRAGGGFVGVHAASTTEYEWPWYGGLVGARFADHPPFQPGTVVVTDAGHPATRGLPARWSRADEWYNFRARPAGVRVLLRADEATYDGGTMGADHPLAWAHVYDGGRAFYTALGHAPDAYADPAFRRHLAGAVRWAAGRAGGR